MLRLNKVLIVEDDATQNQTLCDTVYKYNSKWTIVSVGTYEEAEAAVLQSVKEELPFSLFLLDVQLTENPQNRDGFKLANLIRQQDIYYKSPILFLTIVTEEAISALNDYHCYSYLPKPYSQELITFQLRQMELTEVISNAIWLNDTQRITRCIIPDNIYYIESDSHAINIHVKNRVIRTREFTLDSIADLLPKNFCRCHRRYIINNMFVEGIDKSAKEAAIGSANIPVNNSYMNQYTT